MPEVRFGNIALQDVVDRVLVGWVGENVGESGDDRFAIGLYPRVSGGMLEDVGYRSEFRPIGALSRPMQKGREVAWIAIGVVDSPP